MGATVLNQGHAATDLVCQLHERYPLVLTVFDLLAECGTQGYLVGGTVRDLLLGVQTHDFDFVVDGDGLRLARLLADRFDGAYVALDRERRTGRVILSAGTRSRGPGPAATYIDMASLRGCDLQDDLRDRDFTFNAIALCRNLQRQWRIIDPHGGAKDLKRRILRAVSSHSFADDPVRTLRAVRMQVQFECEIEAATRESLKAAVPLLARVSPERIRDEWFRILSLSCAGKALSELRIFGLLSFIVPQFANVLETTARTRPVGCPMHAIQVVSALEELWRALESPACCDAIPLPSALRACTPDLTQRYHSPICGERTRLALLKCAGLLHDIGMCVVPASDRSSVAIEDRGADASRQLARAWRCSNVEGSFLETVVRVHAQAAGLIRQAALTRRAIYRYYRRTGECGVDAVLVALAHGLVEDHSDWSHQAEMSAELIAAYLWRRDEMVQPKLLLTGQDLIEDFQQSPGPHIGWLLERLEEAQAVGKVVTREQAVEVVRSWLHEL